MSEVCLGHLNQNNLGFVVEYRGNFKEEIDKVTYACGAEITDTLGVVSVPVERIDQLRIDVPSIIFVETSSVYILQDITPSNIESIYKVKSNPYLNLTGRGILVGVIDTGIDYLNQEFIREDDTTRIIRIWDQTIQSSVNNNLYIGSEYTEEQLNKAINAFKTGGDPYTIVPSRDEIGHGTKMSSIIGARGYNKEIEGVANDCEFCIVKLLESPSLKKKNEENGIKPIPIYNNTEVLAAIEYIRKIGEELNKPIVIYLGVGSNEGSHDGYNITASYLTKISSKPGVIVVAGTGNSGNDEGHVIGVVNNINDVFTAELVLTKTLKEFTLYIWVQKPNRMSLNIVSPSGENSGDFIPNIFSIEQRKFYLTNTSVLVKCSDPENLTGHQLFTLVFTNINPGTWQFRLKGMFVTNGRFDIWLPSKLLLPEGTKFLNSSPYNTLTVPSTAENVITVAYYNGISGAIMGESGKGYNTNQLINPDITTVGTNVLTTSLDRSSVSVVSGSSVATAIVSGTCALLLQWGIVDGNDLTLYSTKMRSLLIYGADRDRNEDYPNEDTGYGKLNLYNIFNIIEGNYRTVVRGYQEKNKKIFFRIPEQFINLKLANEEWGAMNNGE
ncbi:MAG: S8 family peptidase [Clostridium sp.]